MRQVLAFLLLLFTRNADAVDFQYVESVVSIPKGEVVHVTRDTLLSADRIEIDGRIFTEGFAFRVESETLLIEAEGGIFGYAGTDLPAQPPQPAGFDLPASAGSSVSPPSTSLDMFYANGHAAGSGHTGMDGRQGETGLTGQQTPGPVNVVAGKLIARGAIILHGQNGGTGGQGQDGQAGGQGGRAQDAHCSAGNVTYACYPGVTRSGLGGLGGRGGPGGTGGKGGNAIPLLVVTYLSRETASPVQDWSLSIAPDAAKPGDCIVSSKEAPTSASDNLITVPGTGGSSGPPGQPGKIGLAGPPGAPCSATPKWGSFWGSCSTTGGQRNSGVPTDDRGPLDPCGKVGDSGDGAHWPDVSDKISMGRQAPGASEIVIEVNGKEHYSQIQKSAIALELVGRYAVSAQDALKEFSGIGGAPERGQYAQMVNMAFRDTAATIADITQLDNLGSLLLSDAETDFRAQIQLSLGSAHEQFRMMKLRLVSECTAFRSEAVRAGVLDVEGITGRALALCHAENLAWLPFEKGAKTIQIRRSYNRIPDEFLKYTRSVSLKKPVETTVVEIGSKAVSVRSTSTETSLNAVSGPKTGESSLPTISRLSVARTSGFLLQELAAIRSDARNLKTTSGNASGD